MTCLLCVTGLLLCALCRRSNLCACQRTYCVYVFVYAYGLCVCVGGTRVCLELKPGGGV